MLRTDRLALTVPGRTLCRDLSLALQPGQCWCLLGRNGAGKTTLLHALAGLASPAAGSVHLDAKPFADFPRRELAKKIGVLLQDDAQPFWGTVMEYVLLGRHPHRHGLTRFHAEDEEAAKSALAAVGMDDTISRAVSTLSGGERQRVRLAALLAQAPDIYLLDEPLQHLDLAHQAETLGMLRRLGRTLLRPCPAPGRGLARSRPGHRHSQRRQSGKALPLPHGGSGDGAGALFHSPCIISAMFIPIRFQPRHCAAPLIPA